MGSLLSLCARIGTMNLLSFVTPVFQPARLADWKVGVTVTRFMESLLGSCHFSFSRTQQNLHFKLAMGGGRANLYGYQRDNDAI